MTHILSATQIEIFELCERKWGFYKLDGLPKVQTEAAAFGTRVHAILEAWLKDGTPIDILTKEGKCAMAALPHLPHPSTPGLKTEEVFYLETCDDDGTPVATFTGKIDIRWPEDAGPRVWDHKTTGRRASKDEQRETGRMFKYQKTPEMLEVDPQGILYAAAAMDEYKSDHADLTWGYLDRNHPAFDATSVRLTRAQVMVGIDRINVTAKRMLAIVQEGKSARELDYNPDACEDFGGCPYREACNLSTAEKVSSYMAREYLRKEGHPMSDILAKMRAKAAAAAGKGAAPSVPAAETAAPKAVGSLMAKRAANLAAAPAVNPPAEEAPATAKKPGPGRPPKQAAAEGLLVGRTLQEDALLAAIGGLCANSSLDQNDAAGLVALAASIAELVG